ncbi:MAG: apolipoprotein N-acyltransferase [Synechococcus sp.]
MGDLRLPPLWRALLGGGLAGLAPAAAGPLTLLPGLVLLWSVSRRPRLAALWGGIAVLVSHRWLLGLHPLTWMGVPALLSLPIAVGLWLICCAAAAGLLSVWSQLACWLDGRIRPLAQVLVLAVLWGLAEVGLSGSPLFWLGLGGSVLPIDPWLAALAQWIGAGGLTVLLLLWAWLLCSRQLWPAVLSLALAHGLGAWLLSQPVSSLGSLDLALWQPSIPTREKFSIEQQRRFPAALQAALDQAAAAQVSWLLAPEGTLPSSWRTALPDASPLLLSGGFRQVRGQTRSSLLMLKPGGSSRPRPLSDKHRLVPLGEWMPSGLTAGLSAVGGLQPGSSSRLVDGLSPPLALAICYEISHGHALAEAAAQGGQWLLTLANLDPYPLQLQRQFLALSQLRAIETGRDLVAVGNTGPTAVVRSDGSTEWLLPPGQEGVAQTTIQLHGRITPYSRWPDRPLLLMLPLVLLLERVQASR